MMQRQRRAVAMMAAVVAAHSLLPLLVDLSGGHGSVMLVTGSWLTAYSLPAAAVALRQNARQPMSALQLAACVPWWTWPIAVAGAFQWVLFAWATRHSETAVATVIYEMWPIVFLAARSSRWARSRKQPASGGDVALFCVAAAGLTLVVFSSSPTGATSWFGIALALASLTLASAGVVVFVRVGEVVADRLSRPDDDILKTRTGALHDAATRAPIGALLLIAGFWQESGPGSEANVSRALIAGVVLGVLHGVSTIGFGWANHLSSTDLVNSLYFAVPVLALGWLWLFTDVTVADSAMFVAGAAGVLAANTAIHLDPEGTGRRLGHEAPIGGQGFRALVLAAWASGTVIVLRDGMLPESMLRWTGGEYWGMLAVAITVSVLILSFRQARLAEREH